MNAPGGTSTTVSRGGRLRRAHEQQIIVAAELTVDSPDFGHLEPMVEATERELEAIGQKLPEVVVADAGYGHKRQMERVVNRGIQVLIPARCERTQARPTRLEGARYAFMRRVLETRTPRRSTDDGWRRSSQWSARRSSTAA